MRRGLTLNDAEPEKMTVLQPEEVTNLDQQFLAQSFHLRSKIQEIPYFSYFVLEKKNTSCLCPQAISVC